MSVYFSILNCKDTTIFPIGNEKKQYSARVYHNIIDIPCVVATSFRMPMALFCCKKERWQTPGRQNVPSVVSVVKNRFAGKSAGKPSGFRLVVNKSCTI